MAVAAALVAAVRHAEAAADHLVAVAADHLVAVAAERHLVVVVVPLRAVEPGKLLKQQSWFPQLFRKLEQ